MSGYSGNALAAPPQQQAPAGLINRLAPQAAGGPPANALVSLPGSGSGQIRPRTSPAFPGDTRHMDPPAAVPMAMPVDRSPAPPPMGSNATTPMAQPAPGAQPAGPLPPAGGGPAPHPADNVGQLRAALASAPLGMDQIAQLAQASDHIIGLTGTLLQQAGPITRSDLSDALKKAASGGKVDLHAAAMFAAQLPPLTDQSAVRSALVLQRQRSIQSLVALHGASHDRGTPLLPIQPAEPPARAQAS